MARPPDTLAAFVAGADGEPVARLVIAWHDDDNEPEGVGYRVIAEGSASSNPGWCARQLRLIADQLDRQGWRPLVVEAPRPRSAHQQPAIDVHAPHLTIDVDGKARK